MKKIPIQKNKYILTQKFFFIRNEHIFSNFPLKDYYCDLINTKIASYDNKQEFNADFMINIIIKAYSQLFTYFPRGEEIIDTIIKEYKDFLYYFENFTKYVGFDDKEVSILEIADIIKFIQSELTEKQFFHLEYRSDSYEWVVFLTTTYNNSNEYFIKDKNLSSVIGNFYYYASRNKYKDILYEKL